MPKEQSSSGPDEEPWALGAQMLQKPFVIFHKIAVCSILCLSISILAGARPRQAQLAGISHKEIEKGCRFWHNSFVEK